ncbi:MAG TPA: hypothetical protein VK391_01530 [Allosphingosinicella sp.]|nr:hypothetical protein [Allosphingosinicella sp.]
MTAFSKLALLESDHRLLTEPVPPIDSTAPVDASEFCWKLTTRAPSILLLAQRPHRRKREGLRQLENRFKRCEWFVDERCWRSFSHTLFPDDSVARRRLGPRALKVDQIGAAANARAEAVTGVLNDFGRG